MEDTFQHTKKCPKCGKHKVYLVVEEDGFSFVCTACGETWSE